MNELKNKCASLLHFIEQNDNYLVTAHLGADGDAYGAALAIAYFLEQSGKKYEVVFHDQKLDEKYEFLWGWQHIKSYDSKMTQKYDAAIVVDVPSRARIGDPAKLLPDAPFCLKIDHHPIEDHFTDFSFVDTKASSTCQLIYEIISRSSAAMDATMADLLLSGIMYDTGRFSFANTRTRDFEIAAHLTSLGISSNIIAGNLFFSNTFDALKIVGYGLANMQSHLNGQLCIIYLPLEIMQQANGEDIDELANYSLSIRGVEVGLYVRHAASDLTKISFRSKGKVDVNKVARMFGGGGHVHAAGCRISTGPEDVLPKIISEIDRQLAENSGEAK